MSLLKNITWEPFKNPETFGTFFQSDDMINSTKNDIDIDINDINYSLNYFETHLTLIVSFQLKQLNQLT